MIEYQLIQQFYGDNKANRSQVPLINHIDEGLIVLNAINASTEAKRAFCLHPMLQSEQNLEDNLLDITYECNASTILLALEYRRVANNSLSDKWDQLRYPRSPLNEVNDMLIADKVQNYKDFIIYHKATHPRSKELVEYFENWLMSLYVSLDDYNTYTRLINDHTRSHLA